MTIFQKVTAVAPSFSGFLPDVELPSESARAELALVGATTDLSEDRKYLTVYLRDPSPWSTFLVAEIVLAAEARYLHRVLSVGDAKWEWREAGATVDDAVRSVIPFITK